MPNVFKEYNQELKEHPVRTALLALLFLPLGIISGFLLITWLLSLFKG